MWATGGPSQLIPAGQGQAQGLAAAQGGMNSGTGAGFHTLAVASTTEQALEATFFPGHLPQADERNVTDLLC